MRIPRNYLSNKIINGGSNHKTSKSINNIEEYEHNPEQSSLEDALQIKGTLHIHYNKLIYHIIMSGSESHHFFHRNYAPVVGRTKMKVYRGSNKGHEEEAFAPWGYFSSQSADGFY